MSIENQMEIKVYFQTNSHSEIIAYFSSDELYNLCVPALEKWAAENGGIITESMGEN